MIKIEKSLDKFPTDFEFWFSCVLLCETVLEKNTEIVGRDFFDPKLYEIMNQMVLMTNSDAIWYDLIDPVRITVNERLFFYQKYMKNYKRPGSERKVEIKRVKNPLELKTYDEKNFKPNKKEANYNFFLALDTLVFWMEDHDFWVNRNKDIEKILNCLASVRFHTVPSHLHEIEENLINYMNSTIEILISDKE